MATVTKLVANPDKRKICTYHKIHPDAFVRVDRYLLIYDTDGLLKFTAGHRFCFAVSRLPKMSDQSLPDRAHIQGCHLADNPAPHI